MLFGAFSFYRSRQITSVNQQNLSLNDWLFHQPDGSIHDFYLDDKQIQLEIANKMTSREKGLSGRSRIGADGLLLVFSRPDYYGIWMKEMQFDIDIVWLKEGKVIDITRQVKAPSPQTPLTDLPVYYSQTKADLVLEVPSGMIESNRIYKGSELRINND